MEQIIKEIRTELESNMAYLDAILEIDLKTLNEIKRNDTRI